MHIKKLIYFFTLIFISPLSILGQEINGIVLDDKNQPLINASVYFINSTSGAITNKNGFFKINFQGIQDSRLITSYIGFKNDTTDVVNQNSIVIRMIASGELNSIDVSCLPSLIRRCSVKSRAPS